MTGSSKVCFHSLTCTYYETDNNSLHLHY